MSDSEERAARAGRIIATGRGAIEREATAVMGLAPQLGPGFADVVLAVLATSGKVVTTGSGTSGMVAARLAHLLAVTGTPSFYLPCLDALHGGMGSIGVDDYVIAFSKGGESTELIEVVTRLVERGISVLAVTERPESSFAAAASAVETISTRPSDADPGGLIAMGSTLVAGAWGDAVATTLMRIRDHSWADVIDIHPGGYVGTQTELPPELGLDGGGPE